MQRLREVILTALEAGRPRPAFARTMRLSGSGMLFWPLTTGDFFMSFVVYMPLDNEDGWRPVHADHLHDDVYEITVDLEPRGEKWRFPPRSHVRCREHTFDDGTRALLAVDRAD